MRLLATMFWWAGSSRYGSTPAAMSARKSKGETPSRASDATSIFKNGTNLGPSLHTSAGACAIWRIKTSPRVWFSFP